MRVDRPSALRPPPRIDRYDNALRSETLRALAHQLGALDGRGVHAHLVRPGPQHGLHIFHRANPAAYGQGHEALGGRALDHIDHGGAIVGGCGDIEKNQLIRALRIVGLRALDRITGIAQFEEFRPFHHASAGHVEAGNDSFGQHGKRMPSGTISRNAWIFALPQASCFLRSTDARDHRLSHLGHCRRFSDRLCRDKRRRAVSHGGARCRARRDR